ncbi:UNVERIFIED_CONTAM: hypothetical protein HDU68_002114 [Siphonaria sp. JEL0065]|nr:hypothetical protein HDU68_002114 [Siphonaria sp. JEL0065]
MSEPAPPVIVLEIPTQLAPLAQTKVIAPSTINIAGAATPTTTATALEGSQSRGAARIKRYVTSLYPSAGQKSELKVWIAREMTLKLLCDLENGWFFTHNCYVVVNGRKRGNAQYTDVFVWIGAYANEADIGQVLYKGKEIREYIGLTNCAIHRELQHAESTLFLSNFKYLRYTHGDRFHIPSKLTKQHNQDLLLPKLPIFKETANRFSRVEAVIYATTLSNQRAQEILSQHQQFLQESVVRNYITTSGTQQLIYPHDSSPHWIYNQFSMMQTRPYLFRIHRASKIRHNAENTSVVIEQIALSKDFETAVEPPEDGNGDDDDDEDENKPPIATNLSNVGGDASTRVIPKGWKIWGCKDFVPDKDGVYVLEGVGFVWVFCGGGNGNTWNVSGGLRNAVSAMNINAPAKVDTGLNAGVGNNALGVPSGGGGGLGILGAGVTPRDSQRSVLDTNGNGPASIISCIPIPLSQKSDLDMEKCVAMDWAKEVAAARGHGKVEPIDDSDIIINKIWISLGIRTKNLANELTVSEQRLDVWQSDKEQEAREKLESAEGFDPESPPAKPVDKTVFFKDKTPFFHEEKQLYVDPCNDNEGHIVLYKAIQSNLVHCMEYFEVERDILYKGHLSSTGVYFLDAGAHVFVWVGCKCDEWDRTNSLLIGQKFLIKQRKPYTTTLTGLVEMGENEDFAAYFDVEE